MSLTNPEKVVTEERLNEYHNTILPYLGGMPDILANKFSRADLYSTDEKMIGRWIDGKPLYQKVLTGNIPTTNDTLLIFDNSNAYIVAIPFCSVDWSSDGSKWFGEFPGQLKFYSDANNSKLYLNDQPGGGGETRHFGKPYKVVIRYTKITDSSVEIGLDTDYSTTEKIVGTWIDGKPVYQLVIMRNSSLSVPGSYVKFGDLPANVDTMVLASITRAGIGPVNTSVQSRFLNNSLDVMYTLGGSLELGAGSFAVLQYTKSTD